MTYGGCSLTSTEALHIVAQSFRYTATSWSFSRTAIYLVRFPHSLKSRSQIGTCLGDMSRLNIFLMSLKDKLESALCPRGACNVQYETT